MLYREHNTTEIGIQFSAKVLLGADTFSDRCFESSRIIINAQKKLDQFCDVYESHSRGLPKIALTMLPTKIKDVLTYALTSRHY